MNREDVVKILLSKPKKTDNVFKVQRLKENDLLVIYTYYKYDKEKTKAYLKTIYNAKTSTAKIAIVDRIIKKHKINLADVALERKKKEPKDKKPTEKIVERYTPLFNLLNMTTAEVKNAFLTNVDGSAFSEERICQDLEEIYSVMVAKAKGELPTRSIDTRHEIEEDENGLPTYKIVSNDAGKKIAYITTQTHLPDERALAMLPVIKEMYDTVKGGNNALATPDELAQEAKRLIEKTKADKEKYKNIEFTDAELIEDD